MASEHKAGESKGDGGFAADADQSRGGAGEECEAGADMMGDGFSMTHLAGFEGFARQKVEAGAFTSEQEAVDVALRGLLAGFRELKASLQEALTDDEAGGGVDGEAVLADVSAGTRTLAAARA